MKSQANLTQPAAPARAFVVPQFVRDYKVVIVLLVAVLAVTAVAAPQFFQLQNITNVARQASNPSGSFRLTSATSVGSCICGSMTASPIARPVATLWRQIPTGKTTAGRSNPQRNPPPPIVT